MNGKDFRDLQDAKLVNIVSKMLHMSSQLETGGLSRTNVEQVANKCNVAQQY